MVNTIQDGERSISEQVQSISELAVVASRYPYYKYNSMWTRDIQNAVRSRHGKMERAVLTNDSVLRLSSADGSVGLQLRIKSNNQGGS